MGTCPREWKQSPVLGKIGRTRRIFNTQQAHDFSPIDMPWRRRRKEKGGRQLGGDGGAW
jgi:hypothetical protein